MQERDVEVLESAMRALVGVALRSLEPDHAVTLRQLRLMLVLDDLGAPSSASVARALDVAASSVTRAADRLVSSGHVARVDDVDHRGIVALRLTPKGRGVVATVRRRRHEALSAALEKIDPGTREAMTSGLARLRDVLADAGTPHDLATAASEG